MLIPDDQIDDFIQRWENAFNEKLSRGEAHERAVQLIELYKAIGRRSPAEDSAAPATGEEE